MVLWADALSDTRDGAENDSRCGAGESHLSASLYLTWLHHATGGDKRERRNRAQRRKITDTLWEEENAVSCCVICLRTAIKVHYSHKSRVV